MKVFPCKECTERYVGCHGSCERYLTIKREADEEYKKKAEQHDIENFFHYYNNMPPKRRRNIWRKRKDK